MKSLARVMAVVGVVGAVGAGASGAAGAGTQAKSCTAGFTEGRTASQLKVSGDTCAKAREVAERVVAVGSAGCLRVLDRKGHIGFRKPCARLSYRCAAVSLDKRRALKVTCTRGSRQIRFRY